MTLVLTGNIIYYFKYYETFSSIYFLFLPLILAILPFYYIYNQILLEGVGSINPRRLIALLLPSIFILVLNFITWFPLSPQEKVLFLANGFRAPEESIRAIKHVEQVFWLGNVALLGGQFVLAFLRSARMILTARRTDEIDPSKLPYLKLNWLVIVFSAVLSFIIVISTMNIITPSGMASFVVYNILVLISGGLTGYFGLRQDQLEKEVSVLHSKSNSEVAEKERIKADKEPVIIENAGAKVSKQEQKELITLEKLMMEEKLFLDDGITLSILANRMGLSKRELSNLINKSKNQNFYGMINEYRVIEAMTMIKDDNFRHLTIEAISEKVGFRSKSSFNACFKKYAGLTPRQYREKES
jgi:AraC-like DNA-binding protein